MAKKTAVKKPRRRLKKTARRSLAAVLMITAIVVAAIPVPENLAVNPDARAGEEIVSPVAYIPADKKEILPTPPENKYVLPYTGDKKLPEGGDITTKEQLREYVLAPAVKAGEVQATEIVTTKGSAKYLTWQFIYQKTGTNRGKVLNYNDEFQTPLVDLGLRPNKSYFSVYQNAYNAYFDEPDKLITKDTLTEGQDKTYQLLNMNNLSKTNLGDGKYAYADFYPTQPVIYTADDYDSSTGTILLATKYQKYFEKYFKADYEKTTDSFKSFWDEYDKLNKSDKQEDKDRAKEMLANKESDPRLAPLERSPNELGEDKRKEFFCEHNSVLKDTGYELELVADDRLDAPEGTSVYVAHGGDKSKVPDYREVDGYLVLEDPTILSVIAYRAFAGVHNVGQIKIDSDVSKIEQSAFEEANITSVSLGNVEEIGARAFYNCINLASVTFPAPAKTTSIGVETFAGSGISSKLEFPPYLNSIEYGAFANCRNLSEVQFANGNGCNIAAYAFYDNLKLTKVDFAETVINNIGEAAFAIAAPSGDAMTDFHFPQARLRGLDDYVLANRRGLQNVYFDFYIGNVPVHTFYNCFGLKRAEFSDNSGAASFAPELFKDVTDDDFCVYGPELYDNHEANPRTSTWDAVRTDGKGIPYVYEKNGKKHYEMALESDGTRYRYSASEDGTLISCALITRNPGRIDLVIPEKIGNIQIRSIGTGCFKDGDLRDAIRSITIKNNSVSSIGDDVFRDLEHLEKVRIGDSVTNIGANAFAGCKILNDVYFTKPAAGYAALRIDDGAFVTKGQKLTFHGDIVEGYAPFEWATWMDDRGNSNLLRDPDKPNLPPVNVCYQSLWDSEQGAHLTVMLNQKKKSREVVLLDYPKFKDLENIAADDELQDFCVDMEEYYYYTIYNADNASNNEMRQEFADIFDAYRTGKRSVTLADGETILYENMETAMDERYGPWINPVYCSGAWKEYRSQSGGADTSRGNIVDSLFAPMVVEAAYDDADGNPIPYFEKYPYNFMDNYQNYLTMDTDSYNRLNDYQQVPQKVWDFINATQDIYVPAGVDSIDVVSYMKENSDNYSTYIKGRPVNTMYTSTLNGAQPGLFSGYYKDYEEDDNDDRETAVRGNDTIKSVTLTSVKELPPLAFDNCEQLTRVEMPAVTKVGKLPFRDCPNMINLVGSPDYPAERGILYERHTDADGSNRYRIIECLLSRGRENSGNEELTIPTISPATDSLLPFLCETCDTDKDGSDVLPAIAVGAFEGCKYITMVDLQNANNLKTIPKDAFKDCTRLTQVMLPGSVNKIADTAFARTDDTVNAAHATVTIYGREVDIADSAFMPRNDFTIYSYEDSASERYAKRFGIQFYPLNAYRVWFYDYDGTPLGDMVTVKENHKFSDDTIPEAAKVVYEKNHRPGFVCTGWMSSTGKPLDAGIEDDMTVFVAQYKSDGTLVDGKCSVQFVHGRTGETLGGPGINLDTGKYYLIVPNTTFSDPLNALPSGDVLKPPPAVPNPTEDGYVFLNEYRTDQGEVWKPDETIISRNMTVLALFGKSGDGTTSGGSTSSGTTSNGTTSGGSTNTSRGSSNSNSSNKSSSSSSSSTSSSSTSSSSTSTTSTTSGAGQFTVFVDGGNGSGSYAPGTIVIISAYVPAEGMVFSNWTTDSNGVTLASTTMSTTTFTMPANNVTVKANYVAGTATGPAAVNGSGNGSTTNDNGSTRVDIEKPGISNRDLATAVTNGSTDNFIVKISETDEATRAVAAALTNKYGTLDNILYYAMDITLWDSTGTHQITGDQLNGLSVDITIPIPDSLVAYGGNNMAGAVVGGDQLESLNESFTTINGVPCVRFRATHFSPYTVYVDTGNLVEGMLDVTPKTGDPIHPKWFLSLGLACLSIILFMKKDKKVAAKAAVKA